MSYERGIIGRRAPSPEKGLREYHGHCLGCGAQLHTMGDPPRKRCVECVDKLPSGARLPEGKTCSECQSYSRCRWAIQCQPGSTTCDWDPSRFLAVATSEGGGGR